MTELSNANKRFIEGAKARGVDVTVRVMDNSTRTAEDAAKACGCTVDRIVKSLVFQGADTGNPYLLLVSGPNRVNEKGVAAIIGEELERPDADFVRETTGYSIGGIPPLAHTTPLATYMDKDLLAFETVWAAAGTPKAVFEVDPARLRETTGAEVIDVTE
ncbi:MAG: YbaK/EbsC family protein [Hyphomicrobiaceae bacterium]|nr:YbaK/EbsC family protein [Hyphomicrobiaceae bacterium]